MTQPVLRLFLGALLGSIAALYNFGGLWLAIKFFTAPQMFGKADQISSGRADRFARKAPLAMLVVLTKIPIFFGAAILSTRIGTPAGAGFVGAVVLVYSGLATWVAKTR